MRKSSTLVVIFIFIFHQYACSLIVGSRPESSDAVGELPADVIDVPGDGPLDQDAGDEGSDMPDGADIEDVPGEPDAAEINDVPPDPDVADGAELPPGLVWVSIPADTFYMGCSPGDDACYDFEKPRHAVTVAGFRMTETEITQAQYEWVTGETPSHFTSCGACPVEQVSWHQAKAFCEEIGGRLPSEAEWEYAARGSTTTRYYCGDGVECLDAVAWYMENSDDATQPVGGRTENGFDLHDMLGNVWEWVEDCWHDNYTGAPSTGGVWSGGDCSYRVLRGGSYSNEEGSLRVSYRSREVPDNLYMSFGIRCVQ